jgi:hypothetical protein
MQAIAGNLPTPDFSYNPKTDLVAGLRPYRSGSYRLEAETVGNKLLIHNYGHGGGGISLAPGCAHEIRDMISASGKAPVGTPVAVLGGGIMGLMAATFLLEMGLSVTLYAKSFEQTTSDRAGGQWAPSLLESGTTFADQQRFHRIMRRAFGHYEALMGIRFGVSRRRNYTWVETPSFTKVPADLIPPPRPLKRLPFQGHTNPGFEYHTLLVEPPIFLNRLRRDLRLRNIKMVEYEFSSPQQIIRLAEPIVINCTGLGSARIWPDPKLEPVKGELIFLRPQPALNYLYSGTAVSSNGYIFPRRDAVVVGGSQVWGDYDETPDPKRCADIITMHRANFKGKYIRLKKIPRWFLQDK